jgi:hypothetical protein
VAPASPESSPRWAVASPQPDLPSFEVGVSALTSIYADDTFGAVGGTQLTNQVIGWNLGIKPGVFPRYTAEGRTALDFTKHQINGDERMLSLELTCLLDPTTYAAEQTKANAGSLRAIRVHVTGSGGRVLNIDMLMQHSKAGLWAPGVDAGQDVLTFNLEEATDATNFLVVSLTLPDGAHAGMIEFVAVRCPECNGVVTEFMAGHVYPPTRTRCRGRHCGRRVTAMSDGREIRVVQVDAPRRILSASTN